MNVVDSSGWLEYLFGGPNSTFFRPAIQNTAELIVPSICILEVVRYTTRAVNRDAALDTFAQMQTALVVDLDAPLANLAARLGLKHNLPAADSIVYATAQSLRATLYTQDDDFKGLPDVKYVRKK